MGGSYSERLTEENISDLEENGSRAESVTSDKLSLGLPLLPSIRDIYSERVDPKQLLLLWFSVPYGGSEMQLSPSKISNNGHEDETEENTSLIGDRIQNIFRESFLVDDLGVSDSRRDLLIRTATWRRRSSPYSCPSVSLICLKRSRSISTSAKLLWCR